MNKLAKEIIERSEKEQLLRNKIKDWADLKGKEADNWSKVKKSARQNFEWIQEVVKEHGFISISKFGEKASEKAWLLVQHGEKSNPKDIEFMRYYLSLMEENEGDYKKSNYAYLYDRLQRYEDKKQRFGTQPYRDKEANLWVMLDEKLEDPTRLHELRKEYGLPTLQEELDNFNS